VRISDNVGTPRTVLQLYSDNNVYLDSPAGLTLRTNGFTPALTVLPNQDVSIHSGSLDIETGDLTVGGGGSGGGNIDVHAAGQDLDTLCPHNSGAYGVGQGTRSSSLIFTRDGGDRSVVSARIGGGNAGETTSNGGELFIETKDGLGVETRALTVDSTQNLTLHSGNLDVTSGTVSASAGGVDTTELSVFGAGSYVNYGDSGSTRVSTGFNRGTNKFGFYSGPNGSGNPWIETSSNLGTTTLTGWSNATHVFASVNGYAATFTKSGEVDGPAYHFFGNAAGEHGRITVHTNDFMYLQTGAAATTAIQMSSTQDVTIPNGRLTVAQGATADCLSVGIPADCWTQGTGQVFTTTGALFSNGSYATSLFSNGYRNSSSGFTFLGNNGFTTTASGIDLYPSGAWSIRGGSQVGTSVAEALVGDANQNISAKGAFTVSGLITGSAGLDVTGLVTADDGHFKDLNVGDSNLSAYGYPGFSDVIIGDPAYRGGLTIVSDPVAGFGAVAFSDGTTGTDRYSGLIQFGHATNEMVFYCGGGTRMTIDPVGVNTPLKYTVNDLGVPYHVSAGYTGGKITVSTTTPASPTKGDIWFDTTA